MTDGRSRLRWGIAAVAFIAAVVLLVYTALGPGLPAPGLGSGDARADDMPEVDIEFHPNPDSMTVRFGGGGPLASDEVTIRVDDGPNRTWASLDADLQPGQPLNSGETVTIGEWSEGQSVEVYYHGNQTQGVLERYDP